MRFPLVNIRLTSITDNKKKTNPKNDVSNRHLHLHFLSFFIRLDNSSDRGTSNVKSASGLPPGCNKKIYINSGFQSLCSL